MAINDSGDNTSRPTEEIRRPAEERRTEERPRKERAVPGLDMGLFDYFGEADIFLGLSAEGNKYIEELKQHSTNLNLGYKIESIKGNSIDCILILHSTGKYGVLVGFAESAPKNPEIPTVAFMEEVVKKCKDLYNCILCNALVIGEEEYNKSSVLISNIASLFRAHTSSYNMRLKSFEGFRISVNTANHGDVATMFRKHYPHAVPPRMDVAATITLIPPNKTRPDEGKTIAVITGYTDFLGQSSGLWTQRPTKFTPLFHMEMHSQVLEPGLFSFIMPAIDVFCRRNRWLKVYNEYGPNDINIGSLIPVERGSSTPWKATDEDTRNEFLSDYMSHAPLPVLDIFAGKYQLPLVKYFTGSDDNMKNFIIKLSEFFDVPPSVIPMPVYDKTVVSHVGIITEPDERKFDSRVVDYLYMVHKKNSLAGLNAWLNYSNDRTKAMASVYESRFENRYINFMKVITEDFIGWCTEQFVSKNITFEYDGEKFDPMFSGGDFAPEMFKNYNFDGFANIQKSRDFSGLTSFRF